MFIHKNVHVVYSMKKNTSCKENICLQSTEHVRVNTNNTYKLFKCINITVDKTNLLILNIMDFFTSKIGFILLSLWLFFNCCFKK